MMRDSNPERVPPSAQQELAWIRELMVDSRRALHGSWQHQVLWGCLISAGLAGTWAVAYAGRPEWIGPGWATLIMIGWGGSVLLGRRLAAGARVNTQSEGLFAGVWVGVGAALTLFGTVGMASGALSPTTLPGVVAILMGVGYFASGHLAGLGWLRLVGVAWWLVGTGMLVIAGAWTLPALAAAFATLTLGPALVLRRQEALSRSHP